MRYVRKKANTITRKQYLRIIRIIRIIIKLNLTTDPKSFWRYIKTLKLDNEIPETMEYDD